MKRQAFSIKALLCAMTMAITATTTYAGNTTLEKELETYVRKCNARIGIAVIMENSDTVCINNDYPYPMNSVMKLYQAMAVTDALQKNGTPIDTVIVINRKELHQKTYSPMRDTHTEKKLKLAVSELLRYSLQNSDNNACDILFDRITGIKETESHIRNIGIKNFAIKANEREMFARHGACNENWNHPLSAAILINKLFTENIYQKPYQDFLIHTLNTCRTGQNRLPKPLMHSNAVIGHKTGTGFDSPEGYPQGINDVGFISLPDGSHYAIAVFIESSQYSMEETEGSV